MSDGSRGKCGWLAGAAVAVAACSASPEKQDKENAGSVRSLLAEWILLTESQQAGRLNGLYYREMREEAETQLSALASTAPQSGTDAGRAIARVAQVHGEPPLAQLRARAATAKQIEASLEAR